MPECPHAVAGIGAIIAICTVLVWPDVLRWQASGWSDAETPLGELDSLASSARGRLAERTTDKSAVRDGPPPPANAEARQVSTGKGRPSIDPSLNNTIERLCNLLVLPQHRARWKAALRRASEPLEQRLSRSEAAFPSLRPRKGDVASRICFASAFFRENPIGFVVATDENMQAYMEVCKGTFPRLPVGHRKALEALYRDGKLPSSLFEKYTPPPKAKPCAVGWDPKSERQLRLELGDEDAEGYIQKGVRPLQERLVDVAEIRKEFARGGIARFDAHQLLPRRLFNLSVSDLRDLHSGQAAEAPFHSGIYLRDVHRCHEPLIRLIKEFPKRGPDSEVVQLAMRALVPWMLKHECPAQASLQDEAARAKRYKSKHVPWSSVWNQSKLAKDYWTSNVRKKQLPDAAAISVQRLAHFRNSFHPEQRLGIEASVERSFSYVRFGCAPQYAHADPYDNILMQLNGAVDIILFPSNCSGLVKYPANDVYAGHLEWLTRNLPHGQTAAPFFHLRLAAGEGVVIPSGAVHKIVSRDPTRMALNAFFEPRYGEMQWVGTPGNLNRRNDRGVLAVRGLWARAAVELWERRRIAMFYHTARLEMI